MVVSEEVRNLEYSTDLVFSVSLTNQRGLTMVASARQSFSKWRRLLDHEAYTAPDVHRMWKRPNFVTFPKLTLTP